MACRSSCPSPEHDPGDTARSGEEDRPCRDPNAGTAGSARYSYRDWVELKPAVVHSQTYTAYRGSIIHEVDHFARVVRGRATPLSSLDDAIDARWFSSEEIKTVKVSEATLKLLNEQYNFS